MLFSDFLSELKECYYFNCYPLTLNISNPLNFLLKFYLGTLCLFRIKFCGGFFFKVFYIPFAKALFYKFNIFEEYF